MHNNKSLERSSECV